MGPHVPAALILAVLASTRDPGRPLARALAFFEAEAPVVRPSPLAPVLRAAIVAALPRDGELSPTAAERAKIAALHPVFDVHQRQETLVVKVIDVGHAFVGLHARMVLLLSRDALSLVTSEELQALAAHELAHEIFWDDYQAARESGALARLQELELLCDGVAVSTLCRLGRDPDRLSSAVEKMTRYNERRGATATAGAYVSLKDRKRFIRAVAAILEEKEHRAASR